MADKVKDATGTAGGLGSNPAGGALATADAAKNDVAGGRKPGAGGAGGNTVTEGEKKESSLRINIELDLEVEVHLTARVKGDITIGLL